MKPPHDHELRLYGHRGSSSRLPENTLPAFAAALEDGANALELDIHRTADGHFVVAHDPDGHRTAGIARHIRELSLREVLSWNVAVGAKGSNLDPHSVPTLDEVLQAFPGVPMSVDLKPDDRGAVPPLLDLLANHRAEDRVTLASFNDRLVFAIRRLGYRGRTALTRLEVALLRFLPAALVRRHIGGDAAQLPLSHGPVRLDGRRFIRRCRGLGLRVDFWVVNDPEDAQRLFDADATGIMTDDPAAIAPVMRDQR